MGTNSLKIIAVALFVAGCQSAAPVSDAARDSAVDVVPIPSRKPSASAEDSEIKPAGGSEAIERDFTMKTLGGTEFWGDVSFFHNWRIQKNVFTGWYRLLDGDNYQHASGTLDECKLKLADLKRRHRLPPMRGKAVIAIHGIACTARMFDTMRGRLEQSGYEVFGFQYPSTRAEIPDSAEYLHSVIQSLDGIEEINFVVHSMGGLVVRAYLAKHHDPRIKRMVMLGVPNLGADMADLLRQNLIYQAILGPAGQQLVTDPAGLIPKLPTPDFEFAVIAGVWGTEDGYNLLIPGEDDGVVSVTSTRLPGAADFSTVPCFHHFTPSDEQTIAQTLRFLKTGRLRESGPTEPIR